ncbi:MAG: type I-E CRISPR-associated endoribonuclease Cas2 [Actinomycetales bacterium]|nr:type I-E CRISPR-associated endoribonuclease Cas2 [Actinomycetales bacterium]
MFITLRIVAVPEHLRGYVSRFLIECGTGFYVGNVSSRVVEALWVRAIEAAGDGEVIMVTSNQDTEQGFSVRLHQVGGRRVVEFDGMELVRSKYNDGSSEYLENSAKKP